MGTLVSDLSQLVIGFFSVSPSGSILDAGATVRGRSLFMRWGGAEGWWDLEECNMTIV